MMKTVKQVGFVSSSGRRQFVRKTGAITVAALSTPAVWRSASAQDNKRLVLVSWGGSYADSVKKHWIEPFTSETGIQVVLAEGPDLAKVKAQIALGRAEWDIVDLVGAMAMAGSKAGYWAPVDKSIVDRSDFVSRAGAGATADDLVGMYFYTAGIAWNPEKHPKGKHPTNFKEYFDTARFPGKRTFRSRISEALEMALVSDGVPPTELYPLDINRGLKVLDRIKPHVMKWIEQTAQTVSLLQSGETDFTYTYGSRVKAARAAGIPIEMSLEQNVFGQVYFGVLKNSPNREAAMRFIASALRPDRQAALMNAISNVPINRKALPLLSDESKAITPDIESKNNIVLNDVWWVDQFDTLQPRFREWMMT